MDLALSPQEESEQPMSDIKKELPSQIGRPRRRTTDKKVVDIHYVDNKEFLEKVISYRRTVIEAQNLSLPSPPITEEIGTLFFSIAKNLANRPCFINYPFKEDMILDGVENCLRCINNYRISEEDPKNPFSYFTQVIYWAFLRRIKKEKTGLYIKFKVTEHMLLHEDPSLRKKLTYSTNYMMEFIDEFEKSKSEKTKAKKERKKQKQMEMVECEEDEDMLDLEDISEEDFEFPPDEEDY